MGSHIFSPELIPLWLLAAWIAAIAATAVAIKLPHHLLLTILSRKVLKILPNDTPEPTPFSAADQLSSPCETCEYKSSCTRTGMDGALPGEQTYNFRIEGNSGRHIRIQWEAHLGGQTGRQWGAQPIEQAEAGAQPRPQPDRQAGAQPRTLPGELPGGQPGKRAVGAFWKALNLFCWIFRSSQKRRAASAANTTDPMIDFFRKGLSTPDLDTIAPCFWIMTTAHSEHITPLHIQIAKQRDIVITESPLQHLTWVDKRVLLKPLPLWLMSHAVWDTFLGTHSQDARELRRAAMGFLRSYYGLVKYKSDFDIAKDHHLIPDSDDITWVTFKRFINNFSFDKIENKKVSSRFAVAGEIRLARIDLWVQILLGKYGYADFHRSYGEYFGKYNMPLIFVFAFFSLALNAILVELATEDESKSELWSGLHGSLIVFRWFSVTSLLLTFFVGLCILIHMIIHYLDQVFYATRIHNLMKFLWDRLVLSFAERLVALVEELIREMRSWPEILWDFIQRIAPAVRRRLNNGF